MEIKKNNTIVVIDDDKIVLKIFVKRLIQKYNVVTYRSGYDLINDFEKIKPSLFIIDWKMPEIDGLALCTEIRKQRLFDLVPIILCTSIDPSEENILKAMDAGAQSFISKENFTPFMMFRIDNMVKNFERQSQYLQQKAVKKQDFNCISI